MKSDPSTKVSQFIDHRQSNFLIAVQTIPIKIEKSNSFENCIDRER